LASGVGPDWRETVAEAEAHQTTKHFYSRWSLTLGSQFRQRLASGPGLRDGSVTWGEVSAEFQADKSLTPEAFARLTAGPSGVGGEITLNSPQSRINPPPVSATLTARRTLPEAQPDLLFWAARGYTGLASAQTPLALVGVPTAEDRARVRLETSLLGVQASGGIRAVRGETVVLPQFTLSPEALAVAGPVRAVAASGAIATAEASVSRWWAHVPGRQHELSSSVTAWALAALPLTGDDAFRAARGREPSVRAGLSAEHSPDGLLRLDARFEWRAATRWEGWPEPDVPAALLLDLGLSRSFLDDRLNITLTGRNVLGAPEQTHPLGATLDGRLFVRVEARF